MNYKENRLASNEVEISIKRIVEECIKNVKWFFIVTIVVAVMFTGGAFIIDQNNYKQALKEHEALKEKEDLSEMEERELTDMDLLVIDMYQIMKERVEQLEEDYDKSELFELDFANVSQGKLQIYIDADTTLRADVAGSIADYINSDTIGNILNQKDKELSVKYSHQLISAKIVSFEEHIALVDITIYAPNEVLCKSYLGYVKEILTEYSIELKELIGVHDLKVIKEDFVTGYVESIYVQQRTILNNLQIAITEFENLKNGLSEAQKEAIYADLEDEEDSDIFDVPSQPSIDLKKVVFGVIAGAFLMILLVALQVLFGGKLQTENEINKRVEINHFGTINQKIVGRTEKLLFKIMHKNSICDMDAQIKTMSVRIQQFCNAKNINTIKLIGTSKWLQGEDVESLKKELEKLTIACDIVGNVLDGSEKLSQLDSNSKIVLVETINESNVADVYEISKLCQNMNAQLLGYVVIYP